MTLNSKIKNEIKKHARAEAPRECCGFILDNNKIYQAQNSSTNNKRFKISAQEYLLASSLGSIKAVYHSHPSTEAKFSEFDKFNSLGHGVIYVLFSMKDNSFTQFDPSLTDFNKYIGRKFKIGKTDCFALCRDFYESELNIKIVAPPYDKNFRSYLEELFDKHFQEQGFYEVAEPQKYDCILFNRRKGEPSSHIGIYLGGGLMLHQPEKSYSRVEEYTSTHKKLTNRIIRHKKWKTID
jgi:proteasome lid subunit RPN8/RPN11